MKKVNEIVQIFRIHKKGEREEVARIRIGEVIFSPKKNSGGKKNVSRN